MFKNIVVGTDGSTTADQAVDVAADMIRESGGTLHLVTAHRSEPALSPAPGPVGVPAGAVASTRFDRVAAAERALNATVDRLGTAVTTVSHTPEGDPAGSIIRVAESVGADLIVVGSQGMQGARRVLGSVPNSVAHKAPCSVLVVKTS